MPSRWILAIDQGTTNTKALLIDQAGRPGFRTSAPLALLQPAAGYVEQDPWELWNSVATVAQRCCSHAQAAGVLIAGIALSTQRETAVTWLVEPDGSARPVGNAISWQCRRSAAICEELKTYEATLRQRSGLPLDPLITAGKWAWLLRHQPHLLQDDRLRLGNVDAWLIWNLTGGRSHSTDHTNASRTGLFNLEELRWDDDLLKLFGVPLRALPAIHQSSGDFGVCSSIPGLEGVPIVAVIGDSHAAMVGHGRYSLGSVKATYGTGSSLMTLTAGQPQQTQVLARTIAWSSPWGVQYALEGNIAMTGAGVQWVGEFLGLADPAVDTASLADTVPNAAGLSFVPAHVGLGAPYWDTQARGAIVHLQRFHRSAHLARAAVDAIAFQVADVLAAMEEAACVALPAMQADGGASRNARLMQFQADIIGRPVLRAQDEELSALGAALLGGLQLDLWKSFDELAGLPRKEDTFVPCMTGDRRRQMLNDWQDAVSRVRSRSSEVIA